MTKEFMIENRVEFEQEGVVFMRQPVECYSRVVGYLRPVSNYNDAKAQEFKNRKVFVNNIK